MSRLSVDPRSLPASFVTQSDVASVWPGAPPGFGDTVIPHILTISGRIGNRAYQWADEALRDSRVNAEKMRTDCGIMESVESLQRAVSLLNWHIVPEDDQSIEQKQLADECSRIIRRTPDFTKFRWSCADCHWYGRSAVFPAFTKDWVGGHLRTVVKKWEPRHGDKLVFRWDDGSHEYDPDQVGIRVTAGYHEIPNTRFKDSLGQEHNLIEGTQYGLVRWLTPDERKRIVVDKHIVEDCTFEDPQRAGGIHGVGIRDRIYWTWYGMIECLADVLSYLERSAFGMEIWTYPAGNEPARQRTEAAAKNQTSGGRTVLIVPKERGEGSEDFGVQLVEPGLGGIESAMSLIKDFFAHKIKRYILGQTLTSEAAATGLGSGVADAHMATFADIIKFLAVCREETLTRDLLRPLQLWNFPQSRGIYLRFVLDTESPDADKKMQGYQSAWSMGARLKEEEVLSIIGASMPKDTDRILQNPAMAQQAIQIPGQGIEGAGQQPGQNGQPGDLKDMFGPLADEIGGQGGAQGGARGGPRSRRRTTSKPF
jgi:phage gp29-like protein